ncbi:MAG: NAD-dependent epimerase/dehydratase family protein [Chloroflexota bacterium]|nr:NAD-dependent epimerase/dehydratase family protein [Chloroflexota bacterium]
MVCQSLITNHYSLFAIGLGREEGIVRILITGGAGFLGSALANAFVKQGHEVLALDDLSAGDPARLNRRVLFHRGSVLDRPKLWTLLQGVDCVYHLAARILVAESNLYPREYNEVNVGGTVALLEAMRDVGVSRLILASSGAIYGEQAQQPVPEGACPHPQSPYAVSKLAAEHYMNVIGDFCGISTVALRIFNAYGPDQSLPPSHAAVVPGCLRQAVGGGSLVIFGDGAQTRDFIYVDDVVAAFIAASRVEAHNHQIINVGSGIETSINDLVQLILDITGSESNVIYSPVQTGGLLHLCADLTLAKHLLNYQPRVSLAEGLRRTLAQDARFR